MANEADTVWRPRGNIEGEISSSTNYNLSDSNSDLLVDASGDYLVSGDTTLTLMPNTVWVDSPGN